MKHHYKRPRLYAENIEDLEAEIQISKTPFFKFHYILLAFSTITFLSIYYYSYIYTVKPVNIDELPIIQRDTMPLRVIPEDKGGVIFSNQDKEIYDNLKNSQAQEVSAPTIDTLKIPTIPALINQAPSREQAIQKAQNPKDKHDITNVFDVLQNENKSISITSNSKKPLNK